MGVRLNKVLTELNIGLQTAVEFLKKKSELGEIRDDATSNTKISDAQYNALVEQFSSDKAVKTQAEKLFPKKKEKKPEAPVITKTEEEMQQRQQFKPLGKIDLSSLNKPKPASQPSVSPEKKEEPKAAAVSPAQKEEKPAPAPAKEPVAPVVKEEPKPVKPEPQPVVETQPVVEVQPGKEEEQPVTQSNIFTLKSEEKMAPKVNVLGKIDLSSINQSTRPKKKTKEEKRKQREEKAAQMHPNTQNGEKRKRERIRSGKVDIEEAAKTAATQQQNQQNAKKKNKGGNQNFNDQPMQGGKKKKDKNRQPVKPLEANEEDVARQVKETLARLTSKTTQNKKGAKYRKEKRDAVAEHMREEMETQAAESKTLKLTEFVTVSELATMMNVPVVKVIGTCMSIGIMVSINQRLDAETINIVADEFGFKTEYVSTEVQNAIH